MKKDLFVDNNVAKNFQKPRRPGIPETYGLVIQGRSFGDYAKAYGRISCQQSG